MSMQFSDTSTKRGVIQKLERLLGFDDGTISGSAALLAAFTADLNDKLDYIYGLIFRMAGWSWQHDDLNFTDYPVGTINLVSGQRDYAFTTDQTGNLIVEIYKVFVANASGVFTEIPQKDVQSESIPAMTDGQNTTGFPTCYDLTGNGIIFDYPSNYSYTGGVKIYFSREGSYFVTLDTTKKAGFIGLYHEYLPYSVAADYAADHTFENAASLMGRSLQLEGSIVDWYGKRNKGRRPRLSPRAEDNR